jgi:hypothetical protein
MVAKIWAAMRVAAGELSAPVSCEEGKGRL